MLLKYAMNEYVYHSRKALDNHLARNTFKRSTIRRAVYQKKSYNYFFKHSQKAEFVLSLFSY